MVTFNSHKEATNLVIHTLEQIEPITCNVSVHATDHDVFFLLLKLCKVVLCHNLYISLVLGFLNITALMNTQRVKADSTLLYQNSVTSCNIVGKCNGISKQNWFKRFFEKNNNHAKLKHKLNFK